MCEFNELKFLNTKFNVSVNRLFVNNELYVKAIMPHQTVKKEGNIS